MLQVDTEQSKVTTMTEMINGRDLRNKITILDENIFIIGVKLKGSSRKMRSLQLFEQEVH